MMIPLADFPDSLAASGGNVIQVSPKGYMEQHVSDFLMINKVPSSSHPIHLSVVNREVMTGIMTAIMRLRGQDQHTAVC